MGRDAIGTKIVAACDTSGRPGKELSANFTSK